MKTALVTGSTDGVGRVVAQRLGKLGWRVLVHGRDRKRAEEVAKSIPESEVLIADFASLAEIHKLADQVKSVDLLVNNAGLGSAGSTRQLSTDGHELIFQVNYLASYVLAKKLKSDRIVNVSSIGQQAIDFDDVMLERGYSGGRAYCQSKLAQIMLTFEMPRSNALHPSTYMDTTMVRKAGVRPLSSVETGADAIMRLCIEETRFGLFFDVQRESRADAQAYDVKARKKLMELSRQLTGV